MTKNIILAALNLSAVMGVSVLMMTGCTNNDYMGGQGANAVLTGRPLGSENMTGKSKYATLYNLNLDNKGGEIETKPSQEIPVVASWTYDCPSCNAGSSNQILVGLAGRSAQACIYDGGNKGSGTANFTLKTPAVPGTYDVRFRSAQAENCEAALKSWWSMGGAPSQSATVGKITIVKLKS